MAVKKSPKKAAAKAKAAPVARKAPAIQKKYTKTEILNEIASNTDISKKDVAAVIEELTVLIERHVKKRAVGEFTLPGLLKIKSVVRPARPARKNVPNLSSQVNLWIFLRSLRRLASKCFLLRSSKTSQSSDLL